MRIRIETEHASFATALQRALAEAGHEPHVQLERVRTYELAYDRALPIDEVTGFLGELAPLSPAILPSESLDGFDAVLRLGDDKPLGHWNLTVHADDLEFAQKVADGAKELGYDLSDTEVESVDDDRLKYGGASPVARELLRWQLAQLGVRELVEEKAWSDGDDDLWLYVRHPDLADKPLRERCAVVLETDDLSAALALQKELTDAGFPRVQLKNLEAPERPTFTLRPGPLNTDVALSRELRALIETHLVESGAAPGAYPLVVDEDENPGAAIATLPLGRLRAGTLRPWAGASPERWDVDLLTDSPSLAAPLLEPLHAAGYERVKIQAAPAALIDPVLRYPPEAEGAARAIRSALTEATAEPVRLDGSLPADSHRIVVELPLASDGDREAALKRVAAGWELTLKAPDPSAIEGLNHDLRALPWKEFSVETETITRGRIQYGGAPLAIVDFVRERVKTLTGHELVLEKAWGDGDDDIWVHVPGGGSAAAEDAADEDIELDLAAWIRGEGMPEATRPLLDIARDRLRVAHVQLGRRSDLRADERALVPDPALFTHYCLDATTAASLGHVAESVLLGEPCLLEGETSVSKTSVILYLASLLGQPVVRLNLNGQTDTGELVGRFVPRDEAPAEGEPDHPWRWQDGLVVTAMKRGWWVVLDELNLAEPQILERLNPALERVPSLVLTEHRGEVIGPGGTPVAPTFRLFATMNPAEYAGRSALSPAYRDRWRGYRYVRAPGEAEYLAMLRLLVWGEQPEVDVLGERFQAAATAAPLASLAEVPGIEPFLRAVARFHTGLEGAARSRTSSLGARRKERYVFTRRGLLALMDYLAFHGGASNAQGPGGDVSTTATLRKALLRYYLARVRPGSDRATVARLLDAAGIGPGTWAPERLDAAGPASDAGEHDDDDDGDVF